MCRSQENITLHGFPHDACFVHDILWKTGHQCEERKAKVSFFLFLTLLLNRLKPRQGLGSAALRWMLGEVLSACKSTAFETRAFSKNMTDKRNRVLSSSYLGSDITAGTDFLIWILCSGFVRVFPHPRWGGLVHSVVLVLFNQLCHFTFI